MRPLTSAFETAVTMTPGRTPPSASLTVPWTLPVTVPWAMAVPETPEQQDQGGSHDDGELAWHDSSSFSGVPGCRRPLFLVSFRIA